MIAYKLAVALNIIVATLCLFLVALDMSAGYYWYAALQFVLFVANAAYAIRGVRYIRRKSHEKDGG